LICDSRTYLHFHPLTIKICCIKNIIKNYMSNILNKHQLRLNILYVQGCHFGRLSGKSCPEDVHRMHPAVHTAATVVHWRIATPPGSRLWRTAWSTATPTAEQRSYILTNYGQKKIHE
jgi:hypothetical protein